MSVPKKIKSEFENVVEGSTKQCYTLTNTSRFGFQVEDTGMMDLFERRKE